MTGDVQSAMGTVIRRERRQQHLTLKALAERASLSSVYLGEIEHGRKYPSASVLERLAEALAVEIPDLLELVADEMRGGVQQRTAQPIGFTVPGSKEVAPQVTVRRLVQFLQPEEATTMAELGAFFIARRGALLDKGTQEERERQ